MRPDQKIQEHRDHEKSAQGLAVMGYLLLLIPVYLALIYGSFHLPLVADDVAFSVAASGLWEGQVFLCHPPLYTFLIGLLHKAGFVRENLRLFGAGCFIANLYLIYAVCRAAVRDPGKAWRTGFLAAFLFLINPMAVRGSLILDIDNTILSSITLLFVLAFAKLHERPEFKTYLILGGLLALGFWSKLSTPLMLIAAVFLYYWLKDGFGKSAVRTAATASIGFGAFLITWYVLARLFDLQFFLIFDRAATVLRTGYEQRAFSLVTELADRTARTALWAGPFFLLLGALPGLFRITGFFSGNRSAAGIMDFITILFAVVFFGYIAVGGVIYGFPKYHYPMLALTAILAAFHIENLGLGFDKKTWPLYAGIIAAWGLYNIKVPGDLIYLVNHELRRLAILEPLNLAAGIKNFAARAGLYLAPAFIAGVFLRLRYKHSFAGTAALTLLLGSLAAAGALNLTQARADYSTTYLYGREIRNTERLEELLRKIAGAPGSLIIAPEDVLYRVGIAESYPYCDWGKTRELFIQAVSDKNVSCVVYGLTWNSIFQYRTIFSDPSTLKVLRKSYNESALGEYTVWLRK
jgi:4-amino-4-deoxy-L-arabinose transferase-like glycosyltransferase